MAQETEVDKKEKAVVKSRILVGASVSCVVLIALYTWSPFRTPTSDDNIDKLCFTLRWLLPLYLTLLWAVQEVAFLRLGSRFVYSTIRSA